MGKFIDISGIRYGHIVIVGRAISNDKKTKWNCACDCGRNFIADGSNIKLGKTRSCGCQKGELHGLSKSIEYVIWSGIIDRTERESHIRYSRYGGRGIKICDEWRNSFTTFLNDMGHRPSSKHSIDRINNDLGYSKDNCRWATDTEQASNKNNTIYVTCNGETHSLQEWAKIKGISLIAMRSRYHRSKCDGCKSLESRTTNKHASLPS